MKLYHHIIIVREKVTTYLNLGSSWAGSIPLKNISSSSEKALSYPDPSSTSLGPKSFVISSVIIAATWAGVNFFLFDMILLFFSFSWRLWTGLTSNDLNLRRCSRLAQAHWVRAVSPLETCYSPLEGMLGNTEKQKAKKCRMTTAWPNTKLLQCRNLQQAYLQNMHYNFYFFSQRSPITSGKFCRSHYKATEK